MLGGPFDCSSPCYFVTVSTWAQFNASIQGSVTDPSGAAVAQAKITLENVANHVTSATTSDDEGGYRFVSLGPGSYKVSVEAAGFSKVENDCHTSDEPEPECSYLA